MAAVVAESKSEKDSSPPPTKLCTADHYDIESGTVKSSPLPTSRDSDSDIDDLPVTCCAFPLLWPRQGTCGGADTTTSSPPTAKLTAVYPSDLHLAVKDDPSAPPLAPANTRHRRKYSCCCQVACWSLVVLALLLVALGVTGLVAYLKVTKQQPTVSVEKIDIVRVDFNQNGFGAVGNAVTGGGGLGGLGDFISRVEGVFGAAQDVRVGVSTLINITARVENPNNFDMIVDALFLDVNFFDQDMTNMTLPPFRVNAGQQVRLTVPVAVDDFTLLNATPESLVTTPLLKQKAQLRVGADVRARVKFWGITTPPVKVGVACELTVDPFTKKKFDQQCKAKVRL